MKVAFITDNDINSGIGRQNYAIINGLKKKGIDIDLINLYIPVRYKHTPTGKFVKCNIFGTSILSSLIGIIYVFPHKLNRLLKDGGYTHVILGHQSLAYLYTSLSKIKIKKIIIIHDIFLLYKEYKKLKDIIYCKFFMKSLNKFENLIFISDFTKNDYINHYGPLRNKSHAVIYQGIDKKEIDNKIKYNFAEKYNLNDKTIFINVGSEDPRKNIMTYLKIAEHYKGNKDLLFIRVGRPSKESNDYINTHKLDNVLYLSGLSDEELIALYSLSKAVISTSLYEGYGRQIFEGYLYSEYTITSDVSDIKKIFNKDKFVYIINNFYGIEEYCNAINKVLNDKGGDKMTKIQNLNNEIFEYFNFLKNTL